MQLIRNGPDIPDVLLQALEEGRVVFFAVLEFHIRPAYRTSGDWRWGFTTNLVLPQLKLNKPH